MTRLNQFNDKLLSLYEPNFDFPESWPAGACHEIERLRCRALDAEQVLAWLKPERDAYAEEIEDYSAALRQIAACSSMLDAQVIAIETLEQFAR